MPEFQRHKRRSLTDEQLYEEYRRIDEPKSKQRSGSAAKKAKKPAAAREAPPVSPERQKKREQEPLREREAAPARKKASPQKKASPEQKKAVPRTATRKRRGKMTLYYVLIGIVAIAAVSILSVTVLFNISSFTVTGDTSYSDDEIIAACGIAKGDNLLRINIGEAEERIVSKLVYIDSAKISRGFPNRLVITVEPARPALSFAGGGSYYIISERGRLLEIGEISADCPVVTGFSPAADTAIGSQLEDDEDGRIAIALQMIGYMQEYGLSRYCEINLSDTLNIMMTYDGRVEMELGASTRLEDKFYHASLLLNEEITATERCTLILSNPDRVVKRPIYDKDTGGDDYVVSDDDDGGSSDDGGEEPENTDDDGNSREPDE